MHTVRARIAILMRLLIYRGRVELSFGAVVDDDGDDVTGKT
jgi:hypothetical protein